MRQEQAVSFEAIEWVHRPRGSGLMVAAGICAAMVVIGVAGIWFGGDRISSMRVGMLGGLAAIGVVGLIAVPWMGFSSRKDVVTLGVSDLSIRDGSKVTRVAWSGIQGIDLSGEPGERVVRVCGGGQELLIREEWMDSQEVFSRMHTEVLARQGAAC